MQIIVVQHSDHFSEKRKGLKGKKLSTLDKGVKAARQVVGVGKDNSKRELKGQGEVLRDCATGYSQGTYAPWGIRGVGKKVNDGDQAVTMRSLARKVNYGQKK